MSLIVTFDRANRKVVSIAKSVGMENQIVDGRLGCRVSFDGMCGAAIKNDLKFTVGSTVEIPAGHRGRLTT